MDGFSLKHYWSRQLFRLLSVSLFARFVTKFNKKNNQISLPQNFSYLLPSVLTFQYDLNVSLYIVCFNSFNFTGLWNFVVNILDIIRNVNKSVKQVLTFFFINGCISWFSHHVNMTMYNWKNLVVENKIPSTYQ